VDRDQEQLATLWDARGITPGDLAPDSSGTIAPRTIPDTTTELLPRVTLGAGRRAEIELGATLGQGGMGLVRAAVQVPLAREVAVKTVRPQMSRPDLARELVREARITGGLEHPNVVPIHTLGEDDDGNPLLVMKRIHGAVWTTYIEQPDHPTRPDPGRDALDFHLDVLLDVCRAVHFAHSKGIVHRDLKPDNVMIGAFGEVYVMDWGLSVAVRDDLAGVMPLAREITTVAGTPAYMAPEMAAGDGAQIGLRSDVYLLGALLHECLTGRTRHQGETISETLLAAYQSDPVHYPPGVPAELAALCNRACHVDPERRHDGAEAFRRALLEFQSHRASTALAAGIGARLTLLREAARQPREEAAAEVRAAYAQCRFGCEQALSEWPENPDALAGAREARVALARFELGLGNPGAAATVLAELEQPPPNLAELLRSELERIARLETLDHDLDLNVGRRTRVVGALMVGAIFTSLPLLAGQGVRMGLLTEFHLGVYVVHALMYVLFAGVFWIWARDSLTETLVNRQIVAVEAVMTAGMLVLPAGGYFLGWSGFEALAVLSLLLAVTFGAMTVTVERRLWSCGLIFAVGYVCSAMWLTWVFEVFAACVFLTCVVIYRAWRPPA